MTRYGKIEQLLQRILKLKELEDAAHVRKAAPHGCHCRRCKAARSIGSRRK